jgi:hypothetical protein
VCWKTFQTIQGLLKNQKIRQQIISNTTVDYRATAILSYDSVKLNMYLGDEASKWELSTGYLWADIKPQWFRR